MRLDVEGSRTKDGSGRQLGPWVLPGLLVRSYPWRRKLPPRKLLYSPCLASENVVASQKRRRCVVHAQTATRLRRQQRSHDIGSSRSPLSRLHIRLQSLIHRLLHEQSPGVRVIDVGSLSIAGMGSNQERTQAATRPASRPFICRPKAGCCRRI